MPEYIRPEGAAAAAFSEKYFGAPTRSVDRIVACSSTPGHLCLNNPKRVMTMLVNMGATDLWVYFDQSVAAGRGFLIPNSGGSLALTVREDGELLTRDLWGATSGVSTNVLVVEAEII